MDISERGSVHECGSYDPMKRINNFQLGSDYQEETLSEFDTEEARLLRALEENVFEDVISESYHQSDDEFEFGAKSENHQLRKDRFEYDISEDEDEIPGKKLHHGSVYDKIASMAGQS